MVGVTKSDPIAVNEADCYVRSETEKFLGTLTNLNWLLTLGQGRDGTCWSRRDAESSFLELWARLRLSFPLPSVSWH
jgi:hypothetical protein